MKDTDLISIYKQNSSQEIFGELYQRYRPKIIAISRKNSARTGIPLPEFISKLNATFYNAVRKFTEERSTNFNSWVSIKLEDAAKDVMKRSEGTYRRYTVYLESGSSSNDGDNDAATSELTDEYDLEHHVFRRLYKKKEADKRQLIDFLLESAKIHNDSMMTAIIVEFPNYESITALGKALGLHHEVVKRKLRKLSRYYDANRFGDICDYLAV